MSTINPLDRASLDRATITLERAFSPDPLFNWVFPDAATRPAGLQRLSSPRVRPAIRQSHHVARRRSGVHLAPPGPGMRITGMLRSGMLGVPLRTGFRAFGKFMAANDVMDKIHKTRVPEPHWYLMTAAANIQGVR